MMILIIIIIIYDNNIQSTTKYHQQKYSINKNSTYAMAHAHNQTLVFKTDSSKM